MGGWLVFYSLLTLVGYLIPNPIYIYIYIYIAFIYIVNGWLVGILWPINPCG